MSAYLPSEAEEKLCPQMLPFIGDDIDAPPREFMCHGPKCAAWRWERRTGLELRLRGFRLRGYCGLAGKPEAEDTANG